MIATTSPLPPGKSRFVAAGLATATIVRFATDPDWASLDEPALRPTSQLDAAYAAPPTRAMPTSPARTFESTDPRRPRSAVRRRRPSRGSAVAPEVADGVKDSAVVSSGVTVCASRDLNIWACLVFVVGWRMQRHTGENNFCTVQELLHLACQALLGRRMVVDELHWNDYAKTTEGKHHGLMSPRLQLNCIS